MTPEMKKIWKVRAILFSALALIAAAVWYFFIYETEEDKIRNSFDTLIRCTSKSDNKGMIDEVADVRGIERVFAPEIELKGIPYASGKYKAKELALRFMQGRKMINTLRLSVHDLQITISPDKTSAETEFTLYAQGNGGKAGGGFREAFECNAKLTKNIENEWVFQILSGKPVVTRSQSK